MRNLRMFGALSIALMVCATSWAEVTVPSIIGDNMVLQRDAKTPVWGWATPGAKVAVSVAGVCDKAKADKEGRWEATLKNLPKGGPHTLSVIGDGTTITLKNILVGDVWVCSGQSNMAWTVSNANDKEAEIRNANHAGIRLFTVARKSTPEPQTDCEGAWVVCSPETVPSFSAVGYFFGREIHRSAEAPVGLISTNVGGTPSEAWTSDCTISTNDAFTAIREKYAIALKKYPAALKAHKEKIAARQAAIAKARKEKKPLPKGRAPRAPMGPGHTHAPSGLYNAMIQPLIPTAITGAIWYQGESNASRAMEYRDIFPAMIEDWRDNWGQNIPFFFVQLANFKAEQTDPNNYSDWALLREAQTMTLDKVKDTGQAVIIDIGDAGNIHPKNKQDVGRRLALAARKIAYGEDIVYSGPTYRSMKRGDGIVMEVKFDNVCCGLKVKGDELTGFAIAGEERVFKSAKASIEGDIVVVHSLDVIDPVAVRYGWADNPPCALYNKCGLPASPFRTDDWPKAEVGK